MRADEAAAVLLKISTKPEPGEQVLVGSRVRLIIDVLGRAGWANAPSLPAIEIPGAIVYLPDGQSTRLNDTVKGESYSGQRNEWWVYPRRPGEIVIPPFDIEVAVQTFNPKEDAVLIIKKTESVSLNVTTSVGFEANDRDVVATSGLSVKQSWHGNTDAMKVGDGITRTITRTIDGSPPLVLPPVEFTEIDGVTRYLKQPETSTKSDRGELTGSRIDSVTYVFKRAGEAKLPPIEIAWFDTETNERKSITLDGVTVAVADVPLQTSQSDKRSGIGFNLRTISAVVFVLVGLVASILVFRQRKKAWLTSDRHRERVAFRRLQDALSTGRASRVSHNLRSWINVIHPSSFITFQQFFGLYLPPGVPSGLEALYQAIDSKQTGVDYSLLAESVKRAQARALAKTSDRTKHDLLPLNPTDA